VHEGDLGVLEDRCVVENDGVIVDAPTAARPDTDGHGHVDVDVDVDVDVGTLLLMMLRSSVEVS
jgi:hypothetical protein